MTFYLRSLSSIKSTTRFLLEKLAKLSIFNTNIFSSSCLAISYNKIKLKDNIYMKFFYKERARLRIYLM